MRKEVLALFLLFSLFQIHCGGSKKSTISNISENDVTRIETALSHDSMEGRKVFTPGIEKAAAFIADEMKQDGLKPFKGAADYYQTFTLASNSVISSTITHGDSLDTNPMHVSCFSMKPAIHVNMQSGYEIIRIKTGEELSAQIEALMQTTKNTWVLIDKRLEMSLRGLRRLISHYTPKQNDVIFSVVPDVTVNNYVVDAKLDIKERKTSNIIGYLPGKKTPDEYVIFSGHYDHLGYSRPDEKGDSLYNGANDDASGITAVLTLAKQFARQNNNDRSILFVAFSAEELGTLGSAYFGNTIDANKVVAMFNIEMIGTASKWGSNSAYITGFERSDLGTIMQQNVDSTKFKFYPDPYTRYKLFYRSDNASLAKLGVPAHSISTSQMDQEPHYHKPSDEISTLDLQNMTNVIKAIADASQSIINKKDTPSRIPPVKN